MMSKPIQADPFDRALAIIAELQEIDRRQADLERQMLADMSECFAAAVEDIR
jgi:hypothetical protein